MSEPDAAALLAHILDAAELATSYIEGMAKEDFLSDSRTQQAVILNLVIIGEAATKLIDRHPDVAASYPDTEWRAMRGCATGSRTAITTSISTWCGKLSRTPCPNW